MKNEKEFLELKDLYKRIDVDWLEEIAERFEGIDEDEWAEAVMTEISGFGTRGSCTLCKVVRITAEERFNSMQERHEKECSACAYVVMTGSVCYEGINKETYEAFTDARDTDMLENACNARTIHMEMIYNKFKNKKDGH